MQYNDKSNSNTTQQSVTKITNAWMNGPHSADSSC